MSKCAVILLLAVGASVAAAANTEDFETGTVGQMVSDLAGWSAWGASSDPDTTVQLDPAGGANKVMRQMDGGDILWDAHGTFGPSSGTGDDFNTGWMHYQVDVYIDGNTTGDTDYSFEGRGSPKVSLWHKVLMIRSDGDGTGAVQLDGTGWQDCEADVWSRLDLVVDIDGTTYQVSWTYTPAGGGGAVVLTGSDTVTDGMPNEDAFATNDIWQNAYHTVYYDNLSVEPTPRPGDANTDGWVDGADYTVWADNYLSTPVAAWEDGGWTVGNFNADDVVDGADYTVWADNYNPPPLPGAVPEPGALALLGIGGWALIRRRR